MGLKSGSRDAGLDDEDESEPEEETTTETVEETPETDVDASEPSLTETDTGNESERPTMDSLPYKLRRDKVNEGREQVPYFLRDKVVDAEDELQETLEDILGETVYKSDYREAAMVVAQRNSELVAEVLREWGYDLDTN